MLLVIIVDTAATEEQLLTCLEEEWAEMTGTNAAGAVVSVVVGKLAVAEAAFS